MTGLTDPDLLPFARLPDFADVQQFYELAMRVDGYAQAADVAFNATYRPRAFERTGSVQVSIGSGNIVSTLSSYLDTTAWDTSAGRIQGSSWTQNISEVPSWWMFGAYVPVVNISGTANTSSHVDIEVIVNTTDYATGTQLTSRSVIGSGRSGFRENVENNNGGEVMTCITVAPIYKGSAQPRLYAYTAAGDTAVRGVAAAGNFWGIRLGPVFV